MIEISTFEDKINRTIQAFSLIKPDDQIGIALSGDDSYAIMIYLAKNPLSRNIVAITIQESMQTSRNDEVKICSELASKLGIPHIVVNFHAIYGKDLEDILAIAGKIDSNISPCALCIGLRQDALIKAADEIGVTVLVDGYNAEDWSLNIIRKFLFGDTPSPCPNLIPELVMAVKRQEGSVKCVSPLSFVRKKEAQEYADAYYPANFPDYSCSYQAFLGTQDLGKVISLLDQLEPDLILGLVGRELQPTGTRIPCSRCGQSPCPNNKVDLCRACWLSEQLGLSINLGGLKQWKFY